MVVVLGRATSSNVMKVMCLLDELGVECERRDVGGSFGGTDTAEYRALNPNRVVPTLLDGEFVLWESNAILRYLAEKYGAENHGTGWWPGSLEARATVGQWMDWQQTILNPPMTPVFWGLVRTAPGERDAGAIAAGVARLEKVYGILEEVLSRRAFVAGDAVSLADIAIGVHAHRWMNFPIERPSMPGVEGWYGRMMQRGAFRRHAGVLPLS